MHLRAALAALSVASFSLIGSAAYGQSLNACGRLSPGVSSGFDHGYSSSAEPNYCFYNVEVPAFEIGVVTLVRVEGASDFDTEVVSEIRAINAFQAQTSGLIARNVDTDRLPNVTIIPAPSSTTTYPMRIYSATNGPGRYVIHYHTVNIGEHLFMAGAQTGLQYIVESMLGSFFSDSSSGSGGLDVNLQRAANLGLSFLQRDNLLAIGFDAAANEVSIALREQFPSAPLIVDFGVNLFGNVVQDIYQHAFRAM